jgi:hypothetical protein
VTAAHNELAALRLQLEDVARHLDQEIQHLVEEGERRIANFHATWPDDTSSKLSVYQDERLRNALRDKTLALSSLVKTLEMLAGRTGQ